MSPVHENDGVGFAGHVFANPVEVQLHGLGVGCWQNQRGACAPLRANGPEQTGVLITLTGGSAWSRPLAGPDARRSVLLPDPRFVVEPDLYRRFCGKTGSMRCQRVGNVFFESLDHLTVPGRVPRTPRDVGKARFNKIISTRSFDTTLCQHATPKR